MRESLPNGARAALELGDGREETGQVKGEEVGYTL